MWTSGSHYLPALSNSAHCSRHMALAFCEDKRASLDHSHTRTVPQHWEHAPAATLHLQSLPSMLQQKSVCTDAEQPRAILAPTRSKGWFMATITQTCNIMGFLNDSMSRSLLIHLHILYWKYTLFKDIHSLSRLQLDVFYSYPGFSLSIRWK